MKFTKTFTKQLIAEFGTNWTYSQAWDLAKQTGFDNMYKWDLQRLAKLASVRRFSCLSKTQLVQVLEVR